MYLSHTSKEPASAWYNQKKLWEEQDDPLRLWNALRGHGFANWLFKTCELPIAIMSLRKCLLTSTRALLSLTLLVIASVLLNCWSSFLFSFNYITLNEELIEKHPRLFSRCWRFSDLACSINMVYVLSIDKKKWFPSEFLQSGEQELCCCGWKSLFPSCRVSTEWSSYFRSLCNTTGLKSPVKSSFYSHSKYSQTQSHCTRRNRLQLVRKLNLLQIIQ